MARSPKAQTDIPVPSAHDWRTTDADEINKRKLRAREQTFTITNTNKCHPIFSNFKVHSLTGMAYSVEIRDVARRQFACDCVDFRINGLGTCKHVEATLLHLASRNRRLFSDAIRNGSSRIDVFPDPVTDKLRVSERTGRLPRALRRWWANDGSPCEDSPENVLPALEQLRANGLPELRLSQEIGPWLERRRREAERKQLRQEYERKVQSGEWPAHETKSPLFPYQREGMLHLAFTERALLADEMGLGKTIQAIAACALLHRLGKARHVLVVTPASLKTEWEEQIARFTDLPFQLVFGGRQGRLKVYLDAPFFTVVNYEQMVADSLEVNERLRPDVVVLDEAQRIKNWQTKTAQAIKRLSSRYAFVLTGTPIENRIDELHSLMDFLNPSVLGPLFRFNRDFYELDERGRPSGYRNLEQLHRRIAPYLLRRRKADVETELPERTDRNHFVPLSSEQKESYEFHEKQVAGLVQIAMRRPLRPEESDRLQRELAMMRMICDSNYILDPDCRVCPKLAELEKVLEECVENDAKVIVFSEWERMLELVRELCQRLNIGFAWHTGSVPQKRRRAEINLFKSDPACRAFLSTDSGSTGLNLQSASIVINCDLPWNPARLEQRIARAWRKHQTRPVTVVNLVAEETIEHRMLGTLANKQALADGVLDLRGDLSQIQFRGGRHALLARLQQLMPRTGASMAHPPRPISKSLPPADRALAFSQRAQELIDGSLVRCEERYPVDGAHSVLVVVVERDAPLWQQRLDSIRHELLAPDQGDSIVPARLEIIDRATDEAIHRLIAAGLIARTTRAVRPLFRGDHSGDKPAPLSDEERARTDAHRVQAARKLKMARLLGAGDFTEETHSALCEALQQLGHALAIENRLPEPTSLEDALRPPLSHCWKEHLPTLQGYLNDGHQTWQPTLDVLERV